MATTSRTALAEQLSVLDIPSALSPDVIVAKKTTGIFEQPNHSLRSEPMNTHPEKFDEQWVDLTTGQPPIAVRPARRREAGKTIARLMRSSVTPGPVGAIKNTGRSDFALLDPGVQIGLFLDFTDQPLPHWHLSISRATGRRLEHRTATSVAEITAWIQSGFPATTGFLTYTLATGTARHAEVTADTSGESVN